MGKKHCSFGTLCLLVCFLKTVTSLTVQAAKGQTTTTVPCSLAATLPAFQGPGGTIYTTEDDATINPSLSASLKARLAILDGDLVISNVESSDAGSYRCSYTAQGQNDNILEVGCEFLTAPSNGAADTLFGMPGDLVTFSCEDGYTLEGNTTLTCHANYTWNATEPVCKGTYQGPQQSLGEVRGDGRQYPAKGQKNKQKPDHGRQKPDGENGKHLDHGKQRPLSSAGGDDGLQQNKTEKSGSVVSKGDVEIDEAPQLKPRKLPEIPPGGEKNNRGISANFDEVVPEKSDLPLLETIEKFDEESPRKKEKEKEKEG